MVFHEMLKMTAIKKHTILVVCVIVSLIRKLLSEEP